MSHVTTHVLDSALGRPAAGVPVMLRHDAGIIATGMTDTDGRVSHIGPEQLEPGDYTLSFDTGIYFGDAPHFYPRVSIDFTIADEPHYHVPLLLSPFGYSTYRGS